MGIQVEWKDWMRLDGNQLDDDRFSFAMDILNGLSYIHSRSLIHGRLNSSNCLVDQRLTIKITGKSFFRRIFYWSNRLDYGLDDLRLLTVSVHSYVQSIEAYKRVYYAPELISITELKLTPPIDIYSFGVILNEIATRSEPFGVSSTSFYRWWKIVLFHLVGWWYGISDENGLSTKNRTDDTRCEQWNRRRFLSITIILHSISQTMSHGKSIWSSNM